jgi:mono/diheme cytochrome c family protein
MRRAAWYCIVLAFVFSIPTAITGMMDWTHYYAAAKAYPFNVKLVLAGLLVVLLFGGLILSSRNTPEIKGLTRLSTACIILVIGLGYLGGELVYSNPAPSAASQTRIAAYTVGQKLYAANCNGCHANGGNVIKPGLPVKHSPKTADYTLFLDWIRKPKAPMPAYPDSALSNQEVKDIFDYVFNVLNQS